MSRPSPDDLDECMHVPNASEDQRHQLLANHRRELAVTLLADRTRLMSLAELAAAVGHHDPCVDGSNQAALDRVALDLHHVHLPLMDDLGVLDYDADARTIYPT